MYIKSLHVKNLKSFQDLSINFSKNINILVGKNNSGKSTIIRAIYQLQHLNSLSGNDVRKGELSAKIVVQIENITGVDFNKFTPPITVFNLSDSCTIIKEISNVTNRGPISSFFVPTNNILNTTNFDELEFKPNSDIGKSRNEFSTLSSNEKNGALIYPFLARRKSNAGPIVFQHNDTNDHVSEEYRFLFSKIKKISGGNHPKSSQFKDWCERILNFQVGVVQTNAGDAIGIYINDTEFISIDQMGDGVLHVVGLIALLLTEDHKLFLIEELENDLHPQALKHLLDLILTKALKNQFIISTHSNIILKHLGSAENTKIIDIEMKLEKSQDFPDADIPFSTIREIDNSPIERLKVLQKLGYDLWDFEMYEGYLILEESTAERIIRDFLIPWFAPSLRYKIRTIASSGVGDIKGRLTDLLHLYVYIDKSNIYLNRAWILTDGDEAGINALVELRKKFKTWPIDRFQNLSKKNFEEYYPNHFTDDVLEIFSIKENENLKRRKKRDLINKVIDWIGVDEHAAKKAFELSAGEVINKLKEIERTLYSLKNTNK